MADLSLAFDPSDMASKTLDAKSHASDASSAAAISATVSVKGRVELATVAEVNTGTDASRAVTPDALAGSVMGEKGFCINVFDSDENVVVGNGVFAFTIPASMNGMNLVDVVASVHTKGVTGTTDIQIRRRRAGADADMLSTKITIGDEYFASDETVDGANDDILTGDQIYLDVDAIHSGTARKGLSVTLIFRLP